MFGFNHRQSRLYTVALLTAVEDGVLDKEQLINDLLGYLSEADVEDFVRRNDLCEAIGITEDEECEE